MTGYSIFNHAQGAPQTRKIEPLPPQPESQAEPKPQPKKRNKRERGWAVECGLGLVERRMLK